ncbi:MAG: SDR family NAD(P)-dependent oxidoreductase [Proteobacteria bacterium]|nr:SDR family NAD(P)-dependent oxidoreductase [Pseudomonadota bacterium]
MKNPKNILITGASSGIGEEVAKQYAAPGITLAITGRNKKRLEAVKKALQAKGATVIAKVLDVTGQKAMETFIRKVDKIAPLDLVIANAGVGVQAGDFKSVDQAAKFTITVNVFGVFNTIHPALEIFEARGRGQIAIVSSLAGCIGLPGSPIYSASKNAVRAYGEALRAVYQGKGIEINVICPGWVRSRITDRNEYSMPFFMEVDKAAGIIIRGLAKNKARISFPAPMAALIKTMTILPISLALKILGRITMRGRA